MPVGSIEQCILVSQLQQVSLSRTCGRRCSGREASLGRERTYCRFHFMVLAWALRARGLSLRLCNSLFLSTFASLGLIDSLSKSTGAFCVFKEKRLTLSLSLSPRRRGRSGPPGSLLPLSLSLSLSLSRSLSLSVPLLPHSQRRQLSYLPTRKRALEMPQLFLCFCRA